MRTSESNPSTSAVDDPFASLGARSARSGALMIASAAVQTVVGFGALIVLTRLISPTDFGIYAMAAAALGFVATFRDFGLSTAIVQLKSIDDAITNAIFWHNAKLSAALAVAMFAVSPAMERFFGQPRLGQIWTVLTAAIFVSNLTLPLTGVMRRQMAFRAIAIIEALAIIVGAAVAIIAAMNGQGLWSLVMQQVAVYAVQSIGAIICTPWMPEFRRIIPDPAKWRAFGRQLTWMRIAAYVGETFDQFIIGRFFPAAALGFYQKAEQWAAMPFQQLFAPLTNVVLSSFSRVHDDPRRYSRFMRNLILAITTITFPAAAFAVIEARALILLLMGPNWIEATDLFRVLVVAGLLSTPLMVSRWIFLSEGRSRDALRWTAFVTTPAMIIGVLCGIHSGPLAIAMGYTIALAVLAAPTLIFCVRGSKLRMSDLLMPLVSPTITTVAATCAWIFIASKVAAGPLLLVFGAQAILFLILLSLAWVALPRTRQDLKALFGMVKQVRKR